MKPDAKIHHEFDFISVTQKFFSKLLRNAELFLKKVIKEFLHCIFKTKDDTLLCIHEQIYLTIKNGKGAFIFQKGGWARGIPMSMNVKSPSPPFIFFVKKCDPPREAVKFIVTHPFLLTNMVCDWIVQRLWIVDRQSPWRTMEKEITGLYSLSKR